MAINLEKSSIQETKASERSEKDFITIEDRALLVSLLSEYGDRLLKLCERIDNIKDKYILGEYFAPILGGCLSIITLFIPFPNLTINLAIIMIISFVFFLYGTVIALKDRRKLKFLKKEARMIVVRLEKVIRVASPIQENLSPRLITKLELDLRLADAESALEYYYEIIEKK